MNLPFDTRNTTARRFPPHYQAFCTIQPVDSLVVDLPAFAPEHNVETPIAIGTPDLSQLPQSQPKRNLGIRRAPVTVC
jgi:hypothetical protein